MHARSDPLLAQASDGVSRADFDRLMVPTYAPSQVLPVRGQGVWLWDQQGRRYLDFASGIAVSALGHSHPALLAALHEQAQLLWHVSNGFTNEPALRLARAMTAATFAERVFFANSGAEANEAALKLARRWASAKSPGKSRIVSCLQAFHGRTLFTVSVGGQPKYTEGYAPLPGGLTHVPFNDIEAAEQAVGDDVSAFIVEPVQGEGGVIPAGPAYLQALRALCDHHGALLIFDEVQCGLGRTGHLYAHQAYGVTPDILTTAKALGNGYPIGAMLTTEAIATAFGVGSHGSTYGGNPLACAVALKVFETVSAAAFLARVRAAAAHLWGGLQALCHDFPQLFAGVRGAGLMIGLPLTAAYAGRAKELSRNTEQLGLLTLIAGPDVLRLLPPLIVSDDEIDVALSVLRCAAAGFVNNGV